MSTVLVTRSESILTITINRPDALNSLDLSVKLGLRDAVAEAADPGVRAVVLTGAGRAFCAGQDLKEHSAAAGDPLDTVAEHYNPLARAIEALEKPVIAAVRGVAAGAGAGLAFLADLRVGGPSTRFLMAFANVGLAADTGISFTLPRLVGHAKALELLMLASPVGAEESLSLGLLNRLVTDDEEVLPAAITLAEQLAAGPTVAFGLIKRQLAGATSLDAALELEAVTQKLAGATSDHQQAVAAFLAKEKPTFSGR